jgi:hypothetical protein
MNELQYLQARIKDLEKGLLDPKLTHSQRKNQARALANYRLDLKRALENRTDNTSF